MRNRPFIIGSVLTAILLIGANVFSYVSERGAYYDFLAESGWVSAGSWSWGFPFKMIVTGLGFDNHSMLMPSGFVLNVLAWMTSAGVVGICCEILSDRFLASAK